MKDFYETKQLYMKRLTRADANIVCSFYAKNAREFALYEPLSYDNACNINYHQTMLEYEEEYFKDDEMCRYYLFEKNNPFETVGTVSFRNISVNYYKCATLGYKIDKDHRHRGYAKEAIDRGMRIMDEELHLHRIEATVMPVNVASMKLLEKVGFEREGLMRDKFKLNGVWEDHYIYSYIMPWNK